MKKAILLLLIAVALVAQAEISEAKPVKPETVIVTDTLIETVTDSVVTIEEVIVGDYSTALTIILVIIGALTAIVLVVSVPFSLGMWRFHKEAKEKLIEMDDLLKKAGKSVEKLEDLKAKAYKATEKPDRERTPEDRKIITEYTDAVDSKPVGELTAEDWFFIGYKTGIKENYEAAINYYSIAIEMKPDYAWAFNNRSIAYINLARAKGVEPGEHKFFRKAKADAKELIQLEGDEGLYNLACAEAMLNEKRDAFIHLNEALEKGQVSVEVVEKDKDWDHLRDDPGYKRIIEKFKTKTGGEVSSE